jgi:hypothetical protein
LTPETDDDCAGTKGPDFLNYAYRLKGSPINASEPARLHYRLKEKLGKHAKAFDNMIEGGITRFFTIQMASAY